jgi:hypothetical protein
LHIGGCSGRAGAITAEDVSDVEQLVEQLAAAAGAIERRFDGMRRLSLVGLTLVCCHCR